LTKAGAQQSAAHFPSGWLVIALLAATTIVWAALILITVPHLQSLAGGADPFDLRWYGYSEAAARQLLDALGREGRAYYLIPELALDMVFPPLYAVSRGLALWWLTMPGRSCPGAMPIAWRWLLVAFPVAELIFDWSENTCIALMIWSWPDLSPAVVHVSSVATQVKFVAAALTEISLVVFAALALVRWRQRRRQ